MKVTSEDNTRLFSKLDELQGQPFDISLWSLLISFDSMGKVGLLEEWGVVKAGRHNYFLTSWKHPLGLWLNLDGLTMAFGGNNTTGTAEDVKKDISQPSHG